MAHCWLLFVCCHSCPGGYTGKRREYTACGGWDLHHVGVGSSGAAAWGCLRVVLAFLLFLGLCGAHCHRWFCFHCNFLPPSSSSQGLLEMSFFYVLISLKNWKNSKRKIKNKNDPAVRCSEISVVLLFLSSLCPQTDVGWLFNSMHFYVPSFSFSITGFPLPHPQPA